jgi:lipopolysaccharide transport system ATP-binding protein
MGEEIAISLRDVSKCFKRYNRPVDRLKEVLLPSKSRTEEFWALRDINIEIPKGQTVGIVGRNGSGKSTMLQIIAGTLTPTTGEVKVKGRVSALLELGSGFNLEFTGRQNVFFNGRLLGLSQKEIEDKFDDIAKFADIGDFIDQPVKTYSSGMFVRLAFAVAVNVDPEVLIVDEALAVGDIVFQHRCMRRMRALMDSGVTTLFVSHDAGAIKTLCNWAVMIHDGRVQATGLPNNVIMKYLKLVTEIELDLISSENENTDNVVLVKNNETSNNLDSSASKLINQSQKLKVESTRRGNKKALIEEIKLLNHLGEYCGESPVFEFDEEVTLSMIIKVYQPLESCIVGFLVCDKNGNEVIGSNTLEENYKIGRLEPEDTLQVAFKFRVPLRATSYSLTVAGTESYLNINFDWIDNAVIFQILPPKSGKTIWAMVSQPIEVNVIPENVVLKEH